MDSRNERWKARFWTQAKITETGCWEWIGTKNEDGYGELHARRKAHRVAYEIVNGNIPSDKVVCHHCDNPPCINPDHLFLGSPADNRADCVHKGRQARGARHGRSKLTEQQVMEIRSSTAPEKFLADLYDVHRNTIGKIRKRTYWKHI